MWWASGRLGLRISRGVGPRYDVAVFQRVGTPVDQFLHLKASRCAEVALRMHLARLHMFQIRMHRIDVARFGRERAAEGAHTSSWSETRKNSARQDTAGDW